MTEQELAEIRALVSENPSGRLGQLLAYVDELHGVLHDMRQEPGYDLGQQEERREILALLWANHDAWQERARAIEEQGLAGIAESTRRTANAFRLTHMLVMERGPAAPHLAPDDLRAENQQLRSLLTALVALIATIDGDKLTCVLAQADAFQAARAYLASADR